MTRSQVKVTTMLFVMILPLMAGFCSAKDNKPPDTKVTALYMYSWSLHLFRFQLNDVVLRRKLGITYHMLID